MSEVPLNEPASAAAGGEEALTALFAQMVLQLANLAMLLLGKTPHPQSGQRMRDLEGARLFIDQLEMIEAKTKGNLSRDETALLKQTLMSLHLAYVEAVESPASPAPAEPGSPGPSAAPEPAAASPAPGEEADAESKKKFSKKY
jgi:hypothetical protein